VIVGHTIAVLAMNNTREFERITGIKLEDWVK
jgi:predicted nucleic acid-binding protein